ncbi:MAG: hypothetical protein Q4G64_09450 [bacterium]|nr:hypothetical protein [bacterium]
MGGVVWLVGVRGLRGIEGIGAGVARVLRHVVLSRGSVRADGVGAAAVLEPSSSGA